VETIEKILTSKVSEILPEKKGLRELMERKKIRLYLGIDPTGTKLHLGHTIPLRKLQEFADLGHEAILIIGTGTVLAGDPSQRKETRSTITAREIENNIASWKKQAGKILDFNKIQIKYNGEWLLKLSIKDIINIAAKVSATQLFKREMFQERIKKGDTVWFHETLYPLLQGYDSVAMDVDLEIGGTDQKFNMLIGRDLQKKINNKEKYVLTTPLILGTDGQPMSKSSNNCIWLDDLPKEMYGKIMSIADAQIAQYWSNLTELDLVKLTALKPFDAKKALAKEIVRMYHGESEAEKAEKEFQSVVQEKQTPKVLPTVPFTSGVTVATMLVNTNLAGSMSEAKRLVNQGAVSGTVSINDLSFEKITDPNKKPSDNFILKKGNREFIKIEIKK